MKFFKRSLLTAAVQSTMSNSTPNRNHREVNLPLDRCWETNAAKGVISQAIINHVETADV